MACKQLFSQRKQLFTSFLYVVAAKNVNERLRFLPVTPPYKGWSVNIPPVRSTVVVLPWIYLEDHAFNPATRAEVWTGDCTPLAGFFAGGSAASGTGALRMRRVEATCLASGVLRNS